MISVAVAVVVYRVNQAPVVEHVDPDDLGALQALVGGHLQCVPLACGLDLWCNEEGMALALAPNRAVVDQAHHVVHNVLGDFFLARRDGADIASVTERDIAGLGVASLRSKSGARS